MLNRANGRLRLFKTDEDFLAFERVLIEAYRRTPVRILDWCIMGNHFHLVLWPARDGQLTQFMRWLTLTHAQRWKHAHGAVGWGHLYQGRFKSLPVQDDAHLLTLLRYVHRNPLAAKLVRRAQDWRWSSLWVRTHERQHEMNRLLLPPGDWPVHRPRNWVELVNAPLDDAEQEQVQKSIERSRPLGDPAWIERVARKLRLEQTLRPRGRPTGWRKRKESG